MTDIWQSPNDSRSGNLIARVGSVTQLLIWINVIAFLAQLLVGAFHPSLVDNWLALSAAGLQRGFFWQPLTYMFLHGGFWHLLVNMFVLWFFGREVETFLGARRFTLLYLLGGLAGAALWLACNWRSDIPVLGASAAALACVVAFATMFPDREVTLLVFFILPVTLKAKYLALLAIAFDAVPILERAHSNVAHLAHLGGAALGYFFARAVGYGRPWNWPRRAKHAAKPTPSRSSEDFMREQIDPILDKISRGGMQSLTARERKMLESARDLLQKSRR
jgi:membrane associated rhomboid family serine protease